MTFNLDLMDSGLFGTPGDKILLPLMGHPAERHAMFIALVTAEYFGSTLYIFHIARKSDKIERYFYREIEWLKEKAKEYNVKLETFIKERNPKFTPDQAILKEIELVAPKLTIMMSRRKGLFQRFAGSIAERVARRSRHSVMLIKSPAEDWVTDVSLAPKSIVVPIGICNRCEVSAVQIAIAIANAGKKRDADITLMHAIIVPETVPIIKGDDELLIQEERNFVKQAGTFSTMLLYPMKTKVVVGRDIGRSVSQYLNKENADLAILGVPYVPRRFLGLFGTDTNEIYKKSDCPVIVIFHKDI